jgi:hypothetical protein
VRIEQKVADHDGKFSIGPGVGFLVEPVDGGAVFPLQAHINADASAYDVIDDARPLYRGAFTGVEFWEATAGSQWLVYTAETPSDIIGASHLRGRMQRLAPQLVQGGAYTGGTYYLGNLDTFSSATAPSGPVARQVFDVRRFRGVLLTATTEANLQSSGTPTFKLFLDCYQAEPHGEDQVPLAAHTVAAGTVNDAVGAGGVSMWIAVGEHVQTAQGDQWGTFSGRFPYVIPRVVVGGGGGDEIDMDGGVFFDLWGVP